MSHFGVLNPFSKILPSTRYFLVLQYPKGMLSNRETWIINRQRFHKLDFLNFYTLFCVPTLSYYEVSYMLHHVLVITVSKFYLSSCFRMDLHRDR